MRVWVDIDNPPQVQYLAPVAERYAEQGVDVLVTARDNAITHTLLKDRDLNFRGVGKAFGKHKIRKVLGVLGRAAALVKAVYPYRPDVLLCASRSGALAARLLGIPGIIICDYEHAELRSFQLCGTHVAFPDRIPREAFLKKGFRKDRLWSFPGLKEALTFDRCEVSLVKPLFIPGAAKEDVVVTFRPPAAETHYYSAKSRVVYEALLDYLSSKSGIATVFLPRYDWQRRDVEHHQWQGTVHVPEHPVPALQLILGSDLVISSGGTMLREAAYFGVPCYSIFQSSLGEVDLHLSAEGLLKCIGDESDFEAIAFTKRPDSINPSPTSETMSRVLEIVDAVRNGRKESEHA